MPVQGLFVLRHLPSTSLLLPAPSYKGLLLVVFWLSLGGTGRRLEGRMGARESIIPSPSLLAAAFPPCFSLPLGSSTCLSGGDPSTLLSSLSS